MPEYYEIKIKGPLDPDWLEWFSGLEMTSLDGNITRLAGMLPDQAALHGLFERIRDLNLTLISVTCEESKPQSTNQEKPGESNEYAVQ